MANETQIICKNIFKNGSKEALKEEFTKKWIELLHGREKNRNRE